MIVRIAGFLFIGLFVLTACAQSLAATSPQFSDPREDALAQQAPAPANAVAPAPRAAAEPAQSGNPLWAVPLGRLSATRDRPLFSASRRASPPVVTNAYQLTPPPGPQKAHEEKPPLSLVGTVAGGAEGIGVFLDTVAKTVLRLKTGEDHKGWKLESVRRREVEVKKGSQTAILELPAPNMSKPHGAPPGPATPSTAQDVSSGSGAPGPGQGIAAAPAGMPSLSNPFPLPPGVPSAPPDQNPLRRPASPPQQ